MLQFIAIVDVVERTQVDSKGKECNKHMIKALNENSNKKVGSYSNFRALMSLRNTFQSRSIF